jgi:hypothetical protein
MVGLCGKQEGSVRNNVMRKTELTTLCYKNVNTLNQSRIGDSAKIVLVKNLRTENVTAGTEKQRKKKKEKETRTPTR